MSKLSHQYILLVLLTTSQNLQAQTDQCKILNNYNAGGILVDENQFGISSFNFVFTQQECCDLCKTHPDCNVFVQCLNEQGCPNEGIVGEVILFGECALKYQEIIALNKEATPDFYFKGPSTLFASGYIPGKRSQKYQTNSSICELGSTLCSSTCGMPGLACCNSTLLGNSSGVQEELYCINSNSTFCISLDGSQQQSECRSYLQDCGEVGQKCCSYDFYDTALLNLDSLPLPCLDKGAYCRQTQYELVWLVQQSSQNTEGVCVLNDRTCGSLGNACCLTDEFRGRKPKEYCGEGLECGVNDLGRRICVEN